IGFFFFQAEDGIRAGHVTGVQTCALPILSTRSVASTRYFWSGDHAGEWPKSETRRTEPPSAPISKMPPPLRSDRKAMRPPSGEKIGRASCRERGRDWEAAGSYREQRGRRR